MARTIDREAHERLVAARTATRLRHPSTRRPPRHDAPAPPAKPAAKSATSKGRAKAKPEGKQPSRRPLATSTGYLLLAAVVTVLCVIGLVMVLSSSSVDALRNYGSAWLFFNRQLLWLTVGTAAL